MLAQYNKKHDQLEKIVESGDFHQSQLLGGFCRRLCNPPFSRNLGAAGLWLELWGELSDEGRETLSSLPDPCLNHVESRARKPDRASHLLCGLKRFLQHDERLFLEGLRLYPHALCRTCEAVGPLDQEMWEQLESRLAHHRLWSVKDKLTEDEFWETCDLLEDYRDLPQPLLDFLDQGRPKEQAPLGEFQDSLQRFLIRERVEKMRYATYELLRSHSPEPIVEVGLSE